MTLDAVAGPPAYHHGDLRRALLDGATAILTETGRWDFSLREVARRAGVSHNAPYRHFADKEALIAALAVAGYGALHAKSASAVGTELDPDQALQALGRAYVAFGVENPALYRLMFGQALPHAPKLTAEVVAAMTAARSALRDIILAGARAGLFTVDADDEGDVTAAVVMAWSVVHGLTLLTIDRVVEREVGTAADDLTARVVRRGVRGLTRVR